MCGVARQADRRSAWCVWIAATCSYERPSVPNLLPSQSVAYVLTFSNVCKEMIYESDNTSAETAAEVVLLEIS